MGDLQEEGLWEGMWAEMECLEQWMCGWEWWKYLDQQTDSEQTWDEKSYSDGEPESREWKERLLYWNSAAILWAQSQSGLSHFVTWFWKGSLYGASQTEDLSKL